MIELYSSEIQSDINESPVSFQEVLPNRGERINGVHFCEPLNHAAQTIHTLVSSNAIHTALYNLIQHHVMVSDSTAVQEITHGTLACGSVAT